MTTDLFTGTASGSTPPWLRAPRAGYYSAFDESPSPRVYGETAARRRARRRSRRGWAATSRSTTPGSDGTVATERSPFGFDLGVRYPRVSRRRRAAGGRRAPACRPGATPGREGRAGVCLEILDRLHARVFELANAVQHTSGQAFVMAFQAGGAHALDRALEAIAYAYAEMTRTPGHGAAGRSPAAASRCGWRRRSRSCRAASRW